MAYSLIFVRKGEVKISGTMVIMYLLTVIPISRGIPVDSLTYISRSKVERGMLVKVPVRARPIMALVISCTPAEHSRSAIRNAPYALKALGVLKGKRLLSESFIASCVDTAEEYAGTMGAVIATLVPAEILRAKINVPMEEQMFPVPIRGETQILQTEIDERVSTYKRL